MKERAVRTVVVGAVCAAAAACTLGPDPQRPTTAADEAEAYVRAPASGAPAVPAEGGSWWLALGDETTARMVDAALAGNQDLRAAAARVREARAGLRRATGARWPQVSAGLGGSRTKSSFVLPGVGRTGIYSTTYSDDLTVSYQVDLFGRLARTRQAAWADTLAEEAARDALLHTVIAQVVRGRVQIAILQHSLDIARDIRVSWQSTLGTVERRYASGIAQALDLRLARENLAAAEAAEVQLEGQLAVARHGLDVLVGRRPGTGAELPRTLADLPDLEPVPPGLPAHLLDRRPDLRQAEMRLAAATSRIGIAMADLYPSLSLTGSAGVRSDSLGDLTSTDGLIYSAVASLLAPIFAGGQLRAEVVAAEARAEAAAASYSSAVLTALREVEDALVANQSAVRRLELNRRRVAEARAADRLARDRYQRGVEGLLKVLETERRLRSAEEALIAVRFELWNARIDLHLALGGDWGGDAGEEQIVEAAFQAAGRGEGEDEHPSDRPECWQPAAATPSIESEEPENPTREVS